MEKDTAKSLTMTLFPSGSSGRAVRDEKVYSSCILASSAREEKLVFREGAVAWGDSDYVQKLDQNYITAFAECCGSAQNTLLASVLKRISESPARLSSHYFRGYSSILCNGLTI